MTDNSTNDNLLSCCICTSNESIRLIRLHTCVDSLVCDECFIRYNEQGSTHCPICRTELKHKKKYVKHPLVNLAQKYIYVPLYIIISILRLWVTIQTNCTK